MSDARTTFFFLLSCAGAILLFYLSICAFIGMEALKLSHEHKNSSGFALLFSSIFYAGMALYCHYKMSNPTQASSNV